MPVFMLISDILCVCMLLACRLCFIIIMFIREGDQVKPMILSPALAIRKFFLLLIQCFLLVLLHSKITKKYWYLLVSFWFCKLASCWWLATTTVSWGHKAIVLLLQVAWRVDRRNHLFLSWEFDINPWVILVGKLRLLHYSTLGVLEIGI
jgi:hypothetical protein